MCSMVSKRIQFFLLYDFNVRSHVLRFDYIVKITKKAFTVYMFFLSERGEMIELLKYILHAWIHAFFF